MRKLTIYFVLTYSFLFATGLVAKEGSDDKKKVAEEKELIVNLTPASYEKVTSEGIVFVDFWAAWCGPCRRMNPILKEVAAEREGKVTIAKVNVDEFEEFTSKKQVYNLPTIIVYKDGKELTRVAGLVPKQKLLEVVDYLSSLKE